MLRYSLPLLVLGVAGILNQTIDKIVFPWLYPDKANAMMQLGIYSACFKIGVIMVMFTQVSAMHLNRLFLQRVKKLQAIRLLMPMPPSILFCLGC